MKKLFGAGAMMVALLFPCALWAQEVTIRIHHFMSDRSALHADMLVPFAQKLEAASDGRIKVELYAAMSLGGRPGDLYDQAADGAVEAVLTLPGYTAGRFAQAEVFELPFFVNDTVVASKSFWDLIESDFQDGDFSETQILSGWVHSPGVIHTGEPIAKLEDIVGRELRGPTRLVTDLLGELGALPVGMPLPAIPENLSKGVISGAVVPWEITPSIKLAELVDNHTQMSAGNVLYTAIFVLAMNRDFYDSLPDDLRMILDEQTGKAMAGFAGQVMVDADALGLSLAADNNVITLDDEETARWVAAARPVHDRWIAASSERDFDGAALIEKAQDAMQANQ